MTEREAEGPAIEIDEDDIESGLVELEVQLSPEKNPDVYQAVKKGESPTFFVSVSTDTLIQQVNHNYPDTVDQSMAREVRELHKVDTSYPARYFDIYEREQKATIEERKAKITNERIGLFSAVAIVLFLGICGLLTPPEVQKIIFGGTLVSVVGIVLLKSWPAIFGKKKRAEEE